MKNTMMTEIEYKELCEGFFKKLLNGKNLNDYVKNITVKEFESFLDEIQESYYKKNFKVINDFVLKVRKNYDFFNGDKSKDPLKSEENKKIYRTYNDIFSDVFSEKFENLSEVVEKKKQLKEYQEEKKKEEALNVVFEGKTHKALARTDVLWSGWECDTNVWVINDNGTKKIINSNHGTIVETDEKFLKGKIEEYKKAIEETEMLLSIFNQKNTPKIK